MTDTSGLGSFFQEEGPGRSGGPRLLPTFGAFGETRGTLRDRLAGVPLGSPEQVFGASRRPDGRVVQFGLPTEFTEAELLKEFQTLQGLPVPSSLKDRKSVRDVAKRLEELPEDDPIFEGSPLDALSADIDDTLAQIEATKKDQTNKASTTALAQLTQEVAEDEMGRGISQNTVENAAIAGFNDYLQAVRGVGPDTPEVKDIEDYKKQFAEATGIDISGKVDKSHALMTFGLALMQNKAGKGFNVGKILGAVGEAGQAAMPALERARAQTRQDAIAAGKFALEMRSADQAKAEAAKEKSMARANYFVVPKSKDVKGFLAGISEGRGRLETLSKFEVDKLLKNPEFAKKFDILPGATWSTVVSEAMKAPEAKELYLTKTPRKINLIPGVDDPLFTIEAFRPNPNTNPNGQELINGDGQQQYEALARMARDNQKAREQFVDLGILNEGTNVFRYSVDKLNSLSSAFGIQFGDEATETDKMKKILTKLQAKNAPSILGEAGKTISDADRQMVKDIVGDITIMSDPRLLAEKFEGLFNDIVMKADSDISQALSTLNRYTGRNIGGTLGEGPLNEEESKELFDSLSKGIGAV
tara:strand:- start:2907 stop:4667 length:1761 start_codon:yes stop_codon:yes gene_type:complete